MRKRKAQETLSSSDSLEENFELPAYFQFGEDPAHHQHRLPLDDVPQVTKAKKELSLNCQKVNAKGKSAQSLNSLAHQHHPPTVTPTKQRKESVTTTTTTSSWAGKTRLSPPPAKVQIINQLVATEGSLPGNGSILFHHLQRKIATFPSTPSPSSITSLQAENGFAFRGRESAEERLSKEIKMRTLGNGNTAEGTRLLASKSDGLLESIIFDMDDEEEEEQDEVVLEEFVDEDVGEGSEGHVLEDLYCDLNDTAEIIEEEEMCELDYVSMQEPIEIYGKFQVHFCVNLFAHPLHYYYYSTPPDEQYKGQHGTTIEGAEAEEAHAVNGTDYEFLLDTVSNHSTSTTTASHNNNQILVEEVDANGYSQIRKANLMELMVAGQVQE